MMAPLIWGSENVCVSGEVFIRKFDRSVASGRDDTRVPLQLQAPALAAHDAGSMEIAFHACRRPNGTPTRNLNSRADTNMNPKSTLAGNVIDSSGATHLTQANDSGVSRKAERVSMDSAAAPRLKRLCEALGMERDSEHILSVFRRLVAPWGATAPLEAPPWLSEVGDDHTPFEFSAAFGS